MILLTVIRVTSTHRVFAQTSDEPAHIAAGHEWMTRGTYHLDFEHPPIPRVLFALPFRHVRTQSQDKWEYGNDLYAHGDRYIHNVAKARRPNLIFLIIGGIAVAAIARRMFDPVVAWIATALFLFLPPILAHAGVAATDMAGVAAFAIALYALLLWCDDPSWRRTILLGAAIASGIVCKYSFLFYFPVTMIIVLVARRRLVPARLLVAGLTASLVVWAAFGFSFSTMAEANPQAAMMARDGGVPEKLIRIPVPAPDLLMGVLAVKVHNRAGHPSYLLGELSSDGWWYYFPIALAIKTPIPFLILALVGGALLIVRRHPAAVLLVIAAAILLIGMSARINIGVRHILPIYVPLSILAAFAVVELWRGKAVLRAALVAALVWLGASSVLAHPDYIPWMNAFAGRQPERVLLDSNYDWGQDIWRLIRVCRKRGITSLGYSVFTNIRPSTVGITSGYPLDENIPGKGWIVLSEQNLQMARAKNPQAFDWLTRAHRFERIGKTLRLYHVR